MNESQEKGLGGDFFLKKKGGNGVDKHRKALQRT